MTSGGGRSDGLGSRSTRLLAVALISASVLAYEVLLARLLSIVQWYHFAYMIISVALFGYGISGTLIALAERRLRGHAELAFGAFAAAFGLSAVACFQIAQRIPFNALEILWDPIQLLHLLSIYGLLTVPFLCGASCIGIALRFFPDPVGRIYGADLLGAGGGALGVLLLLFLVFPARALQCIGALALLAAALALLGRDRRLVSLAFIGMLALLLGLPEAWIGLRPSPHKALSRTLEIPGTVVEAERSSPLGLLSAVRSSAIPFRHVPGQSLEAVAEPPAQIGVFTDGDALSPITAFDGDPGSLAYLDLTLQALPYDLLERPKVLILGAGGGAEVLSAIRHRARRIDAVELNPQMTALVRDTYGEFAGHILEREDVRPLTAEARSFVASSPERYDLIELPLLDSFATAGVGLHESFVYTVEAFEDYLDHLEPGGLLSITRWLKLPPRDSLKLYLTALTALERRGVASPADRIALLRSWDTSLLLVKNGLLTAADGARIRAFAAARSFDLAHLPGLQADDANRFNVLPEPLFFQGARALAGPGRRSFIDRYKFDLEPATDDRPYFFDFFRWRALPDVAEAAVRSGAALLEWGHLILTATVVQAALLSLLLVLLPLWLRLRREAAALPPWTMVAYFALIGLAFLFVEIASIQRFTLFLGHPLHALGVVLAGFLVFAGLGSGYAPSLAARREGRRIDALTLIVGVIAVLALLHLLALPPVLRALIGLPEPLRLALALGLIAPLAFAMGMPFPLAMARLRVEAPEMVPWAWGINGAASVVAAGLATLLAIGYGAATVVAVAIVLYALAALVLPRADQSERSAPA